MNALAACFGWNANTGWDASAPKDISENCDPTKTSCTIVTSDTFPMKNECGCVLETEDIGNGCGCCTMPRAAGTLIDDLGAILSDYCQPPVSYTVNPPSCDMPSNGCGSVDATSECGQGQQMSAPGADLHLQLDPLNSYVLLDDGTSTVQVAVTGSGAANINPDGFMRAAAWADDAVLGSLDLDDWAFFFDHPMSIDLAQGSFTVPSDDGAVFVGSGLIDGAAASFSFPLGQDATGAFDAQSLTWWLDYTEQVGPMSVDVRLEGTYQQVP